MKAELTEMLMKGSSMVFLLLLSVATALATGDRKLSSKGLQPVLEQAVAQQEGDWRLKRSEAREKADARGVPGVLVRWTPKEGVEMLSVSDKRTPHPYPDVEVEVRVYDSPGKASERLRLAVEGTSVGPSDSVKDLGDEAYVWTGDSPHGSSTVRVLAGRTLIIVNGPLLDVTMRFAELATREVETELSRVGEAKRER